MRPDPIVDISTVDLSQVIADKAAVLEANPQRFEMQQVDAIVRFERDSHLVIGYKDVRGDEFWVRGHMPGFPLMPGVLICEAAAQLISYYVTVAGIKVRDYLAFGGMEQVRFRGMVKPGDRLVLVGKGTKVGKVQAIFHVQGYVGAKMVFHGDIIGMQMNKGQPQGEEG
jgi:3-hydroxyacyl-[acyl-carrier-protein] dehydratase